MKKGIIILWIIVNVIAITLVFNPWVVNWTSQAIVFFVLEAVFLVLIGLPVFLYHFLRRKQSFGQSISDSLETVLNFLTGWV